MDIQLINKSYEIHKQNLIHCANFKQDDLKMSEAGRAYWLNRDVARLLSVYYFNKYINELKLAPKKLLSFGAQHDIEIKLLKHESWFDCDYWTDFKHDVENLASAQLDKDFDFCIINQVFEHLTDIESAIKNINDHLSRNGYLYCNFPVLNIPHAEPFMFFTGITVQYIIYLCIKHGFSIVKSGQWGNQEYIEYIYNNLSWPDYTHINSDTDIRKPCVGWVLAKKIK